MLKCRGLIFLLDFGRGMGLNKRMKRIAIMLVVVLGVLSVPGCGECDCHRARPEYYRDYSVESYRSF